MYVNNSAQNPAMRSMSILLLIHLLWPANRAVLEAIDQSFPPRPALFIRRMLILKPSGFRQLFSNLWVTHPHTATPSLIKSEGPLARVVLVIYRSQITDAQSSSPRGANAQIPECCHEQ